MIGSHRFSRSQAAQGSRAKTAAFVLLVLVFVGFVLAHVMGSQGIWGWIEAFCEASLVGALADWFAVVALFRRPLGLPIPHTAILPRHKARVADGIAQFIRERFLAKQTLIASLRQMDPARQVGQWLARTQARRHLVRWLQGVLYHAVRLTDQPSVRAAISAWMVQRLRRWNVAVSVSGLLDRLLVDGQQQRLLDGLLRRLARWINHASVKAKVSALIVRYARREWPALVGTVNWVKPVGEIGDRLAERIAKAALDELQTILTVPSHPIRQSYERWLKNGIQRLRQDPVLIARVEHYKQQCIDHPLLPDTVQDLWRKISHSLRRDLVRRNSTFGTRLAHVLQASSWRLRRDARLRQAVNTYIVRVAGQLTDVLAPHVTQYIAATINHWNDAQLTQEIEESIGSDLQYIRINGTLVGGLIGLLLYFFQQAF